MLHAIMGAIVPERALARAVAPVVPRRVPVALLQAPACGTHLWSVRQAETGDGVPVTPISPRHDFGCSHHCAIGVIWLPVLLGGDG